MPVRRWMSRSVFGSAAALLVIVAFAGTQLVGLGVARAEDTPLKAWMKTNMGAPRASNDFPGLLKAFDKVTADVPDPTWTEWAPLSKQGAAAAKAENMKGVKESCNGCHVKYKDAYKAKFPGRPAPR